MVVPLISCKRSWRLPSDASSTAWSGLSPWEDDIVQDAFLALYVNIDRIEHLRPFLFRVVRNRCYDELRRKGRFQSIFPDEAIDDNPNTSLFFLTDRRPPPDEEVHWILIGSEVQKAIDRLPESQRQTMILYCEEDLSYEQIAEVMAADKEKVSLALLATGQLSSFIEGQTGLVGIVGSGSTQTQADPTTILQRIRGLLPETIHKIVDRAIPPMFDRFSDRARKVVVIAQEEAKHLNYDYVGTEHFLLSIIKEGGNLALAAMKNMGVDLEGLQKRTEETLEAKDGKAVTGKTPFTPRAKKVLELAIYEGRELGHNYVGTEHILLGMIKEGGGVAAQLLAESDVTLEKTRAQVIELLGGKGIKSKSTIWNITQVFNNSPGGFPLSSTFDSSGGTLLIFAGGSGYATDANNVNISFNIEIDDKAVGVVQRHTKGGGDHVAFPAGNFVVEDIAEGSHTIKITSGSMETRSDNEDRFYLTIMELPFSAM